MTTLPNLTDTDLHPMHSHLMISDAAMTEVLDDCQRYRSIAFIYEDGVVVDGSYMDHWQLDVQEVLPYDRDGNNLVKLPWKYVMKALDSEQMNAIFECMDVDSRLLGYAIG